MRVARFAFSFALLAMTSCASQQQIGMAAQKDGADKQNIDARLELQGCSQKYPKEERSSANAVPFAKCVLSALDHFYTKPSDIEYAVAYKRLALAESLQSRKISLAEYESEFASYAAEMQTQLQMRQNQARIVSANERAARSADCIAKQQHQANANYSGIDSTNGIVAVGSLLGAVGDQAAVSQACN